MESKEVNRKTIQGVVVSDKMDKTITVLVTSKKRHPIYKKYMTYTKKYKAHDENNVCNEGDIVRIVETRPISSGKCWKVAEVVEKAR